MNIFLQLGLFHFSIGKYWSHKLKPFRYYIQEISFLLPRDKGVCGFYINLIGTGLRINSFLNKKGKDSSTRWKTRGQQDRVEH